MESILPSTPQGIDLTNVTSIGDNAFEGNTLNDDLDFSNVETLGTGVFTNATINGDVTFGNRTTIPSGTFASSTINGLIDFENITTIKSNAFLNVKKLSQDLIFDNSINIEESAFSGAKLQNVKPDAMRELSDSMRDSDPLCICVLASDDGVKGNICVACGKEAVKLGAHAGNLARAAAQAAGGSGGGRPDSAMAGFKDLSNVDACFEAAKAAIEAIAKK